MKRNAQNQRDWATQQVREKNQTKAQEKMDEQMYAQQTEAITRMRGMLEDEATQKKAQMMKEMQEENKRLALEKKRREQSWKEDQQMQDKAETTLTNHNETLDANGKITRSWMRGLEKEKSWLLLNEVLEQTNNYWSISAFN